MSINTKVLVDTLVESGKFNKKEATLKVKAAIEAVQKALPGSEDETIEKMVKRKILKATSPSTGEKFDGVCVACTEKQDANGIAKKIALAAYKVDPMTAVQDGIVKIVDEKIVPLDNRRFIDRAEKYENRNFGKTLPIRMQREVYFVINNVLTRAYGNVDPEVGMRYEIYGKMTGGGNITISKTGIRPVEKVGDVWKFVYEAVSESDFAVSIDDIAGMDKNKVVIINGVVKYSGETTNGAMLVVGEDESETTVAAFAFPGVCADTMMCCEADTEVIVFGKVLESEDRENPGKMRKAISAIGVVPNPESMKAIDALKDLDELFMN